ncbi:MAG TPA: SDR family oxidoreductase [Chitinophagaceae bacterium]|jgi:NAD(P)-dependent dehydrogenase (short-subunit alcohol dehydrogenase family)|nr:SDR family oxidoreductase [Chitinophagaceae bacterium]
MKAEGNALAGKVMVVTGASSGAGRAIAVELAREGAFVVLAARRVEALEEVAAECRALGADARVVPTDTRKPGDVQALAEAAAAVSGRIDMWVNNAGVLAAGALEALPVEVNDDVIRTNLLGYMHGAWAVLPFFKRQGYGILVNNISVGGWFPTPYAAAYSASKFGLRGFSESLKGELSAYPSIHVCDLYPGFLDTPGIQHAANYTGHVLRPAPPVYDPRQVARAVVQLAVAPQSRRMVDAASSFLRLSYSLFPRLSRNLTGAFIRAYLRRADGILPTDGNVLEPVEYGNGIDGGWRNRAVPGPIRSGALLAAGLTLGLLLFSRRP